jgi:hypothetical protein
MMKEEFEKLAGFDVSYDEFKEIEAEYMATDIDKEKFVVDWKKNDGIGRVSRLRIRSIEVLSSKIQALTRNYNLALEREENKDGEHEAELERWKKDKADADSVADHWREKYVEAANKYLELEGAIKTIFRVVA